MEHPDLNFLIQREIQNDRIRAANARRQVPEPITTHPLRRIAGGILITMGSKIAATPRPAAGRPAIGGVALAGRVDR
jgi:hypothetical protein